MLGSSKAALSETGSSSKRWRMIKMIKFKVKKHFNLLTFSVQYICSIQGSDNS